MNIEQESYIKNTVLPNFVSMNNNFKLDEYVDMYPDMQAMLFELDGNKFALLFADHLSDDLDLITDKLKEVNVKVKRFLPLINNQNEYIYCGSRKVTPYVYEPIFDDCFVCGRL